MRVVPKGGPEEWVEIRIRAEHIRTSRRRNPLTFDVTLYDCPETQATLEEILAPGSMFRRDYRDIRVERRTVRTVATAWEPVLDGKLASGETPPML